MGASGGRACVQRSPAWPRPLVRAHRAHLCITCRTWRRTSSCWRGWCTAWGPPPAPRQTPTRSSRSCRRRRCGCSLLQGWCAGPAEVCWEARRARAPLPQPATERPAAAAFFDPPPRHARPPPSTPAEALPCRRPAAHAAHAAAAGVCGAAGGAPGGGGREGGQPPQGAGTASPGLLGPGVGTHPARAAGWLAWHPARLPTLTCNPCTRIPYPAGTARWARRSGTASCTPAPASWRACRRTPKWRCSCSWPALPRPARRRGWRCRRMSFSSRWVLGACACVEGWRAGRRGRRRWSHLAFRRPRPTARRALTFKSICLLTCRRPSLPCVPPAPPRSGLCAV